MARPEARRYERQPFNAFVEVWHPEMGAFEWCARDISEGGIFVRTGTSIKPPVGTVLKVRLKRHTGLINIEPMSMQVVHHQGDGIGMMYLFEDEDAIGSAAAM